MLNQLVKDLENDKYTATIVYKCSSCGKEIMSSVINLGYSNAYLNSLCNNCWEEANSDVLLHNPSLSEYQKDVAIQQAIFLELLSHNITPDYLGYRYLRDAIHRVIVERDKYETLTKTIYPEIAEKYDTTSEGVERSIRLSIQASGSKVSNKRFITVMAENISLGV